MFPRREASGLKDPPRGRRGRIQEKRSKYDLSVSSSCTKRKTRSTEIKAQSVEEALEEDQSREEENEELPPEPTVQFAPTPVQESPAQKRISLKPSGQKVQICCCNRRINDTIVVPQPPRKPRDYKPSEKCISLDPPVDRPNDYVRRSEEPNPTSPNFPPRFFRPNSIPQLQRYYWDIGDTTYIEFTFSEQCKTVSTIELRGFKMWRYWCQTFSMDCTVGDLVLFIEHHVDVPFTEYRLISKCRNKQEEILPVDWYKTLRCLLLYPKATILILPRQPNHCLKTWLRVIFFLLLSILLLWAIIRCSIALLSHSWSNNYQQ